MPEEAIDGVGVLQEGEKRVLNVLPKEDVT
jgi:hypothetical protein